ncbi:MAG: diaminopimelate decarboxylase [Cellvibrionaceae bacterium]|nr:diaminopimelate decarboxylase [Cellvibrionaceae bacterium]MCV6627309.1 diaminopimelate decarboxylase [Cellvibrionaceae bacterium]
MQDFHYSDNGLMAEQTSLTAIAEQYGTPCYVYSRATIRRNYLAYADALAGRGMACYAVKANSNLAILAELAQLGAGFDIVSEGELERVLAAGGKPERIVFSGVGKKAGEMARALEVGIHCFNVESASELELLAEVAAAQGTVAPISLRVNPDVDAKTHPYISTGLKENKFGIDIQQAPAVYRRAAELPSLAIKGVDCHIGSQLTELPPFLDALERLLALTDQLASDGIELEHLDLGGGLGVRYQDEAPPAIADLVTAVEARLDQRGGTPLQLIFEPGRSIVANAGVLLTQVEYLKPTGHKNFAIIDAAMNDNIRPSLYQAWQQVLPLQTRAGDSQSWDLVGPVCETGDFMAKDRQLALAAGDYLAVMSAGAYGFTMSSNYNTRPRAAELMVDGERAHLVRRRETIAELFAQEQLLPDQ